MKPKEMLMPETVADTTTDLIKSYVQMQLAAAYLGHNGKLSLKQLYTNITRYAILPKPLSDQFTYDQFLELLESLPEEMNLQGELGVDINYLSF